MSDTPNDLRYAATHEWAAVDDDVATVGISDFAQEALGDVVFVELPEAGQLVRAGEEAAVVESVKAAADVYAPLTGTVLAVNEALEEAPELVNEAPYGDGWFFRMRIDNEAELDDLLDAAAYRERCEAENDG